MDLVVKSCGIFVVIAALGNYLTLENFLVFFAFGWLVAEHLKITGGAPVY